MHIEDEETIRLIRELANATGEDELTALTSALRERLDRRRGDRESSLAERLLAIGHDCASHFKEPFKSIDHGELLYGDYGLPE